MPDIRRAPEVDDFNYVMNPIEDGGDWEKWHTGGVRATGSAFHPAHINSDSFYNYRHIVVNGDMEVWALGTGSPDITEGWRIGFVQSNGGAANGEGYGYQVWIGDNVSNAWQLRRYDGPTVTVLHTSGAVGNAQNAYCLLRRNRSRIEAYRAVDPTGIWTQVFSVEDATYTTRMQPGLGLSSDDGTQESWTSFGAGPVYRTQIYRYVSN